MCAVPLRLGLALAAVAVGACATVRPPGDGSARETGDVSAADSPARPRSLREGGGSPPAALADGGRGLASYYSDKLAGNKTASGERYDPNAMTAAHRTLPFGTWVEVTRTGGRSVRVRITDRGPFGDEKRVIDLSKRAARELDMLRAGVVEITLHVVDGP